MSVKREAPARGGGRRRQSEGPARKTSRRPAEVPPSRRTRPRGGKASAPTREPRAPRSGPNTARTARPTPATSTRQAKARAKARKAKAPKVIRPPLRERLIARLASIDLRPRTLLAKVPFVVLVIGALGLGLGITLWLSTDSAERSYRLGSVREENRALLQQKEALERDVLEAQAAPALAEAARDLGMIPSRDTAHLVQDPAGNWVVVGTPTPAAGVPLPPLNTKLPDESAAPPAAPASPLEVPVRVLPRTEGPAGAVPGGPEVLQRSPDASAPAAPQQLPGAVAAPVPLIPDTPTPDVGAPPAPVVVAPPVPGVGTLPGPPPEPAVPAPATPVGPEATAGVPQ